MRQMDEMGLMPRYKEDAFTKDILLKMMALPLLHQQHIRAAFDNLVTSISPDDDLLLQFKDYVHSQWMSSSSIYPLSSISVFQLSIRNRTDCQGYHNRLKLMYSRGMYPLFLSYTIHIAVFHCSTYN